VFQLVHASEYKLRRMRSVSVRKNGGQTPFEISDPCCCLQPSACPSSSCHQETGIWRYWSINGFVLCVCWNWIELRSTVNRPFFELLVVRHCPIASNKHSYSLRNIFVIKFSQQLHRYFLITELSGNSYWCLILLIAVILFSLSRPCRK